MNALQIRHSAATRPAGRRGFTMIELLIVISVIAALAAMGFPMYKVIQRKVYIGSTATLVQAVSAAITTYGQSTWTWRQRRIANPVTDADWSLRTAYLWDMNQWIVNQAGGLSADMSLSGRITTGDIPTSPTPKPPVQPTKFRVIDGRPDQNAWALVSSGSNPPNFSAAPTYSDDSQLFDGPFDTDLINSGYSGFYDMCQPSIAKKFVNKRHQIIDAWGQPLRIAYAAKTYGASAFGVWSAGPNQVDAQDADSTGAPLDVFPNGAKGPSDDITSWKNNAAN
ncbi:MAG: type II secretion system protein [Planctomycetes bacterium]|nr:type II secretion system protein [Planctomycetota bacterium]